MIAMLTRPLLRSVARSPFQIANCSASSGNGGWSDSRGPTGASLTVGLLADSLKSSVKLQAGGEGSSGTGHHLPPGDDALDPPIAPPCRMHARRKDRVPVYQDVERPHPIDIPHLAPRLATAV